MGATSLLKQGAQTCAVSGIRLTLTAPATAAVIATRHPASPRRFG